ncbi:carbohydrate binding domain-containing protein [Thalassobellus suaedae]|uniref:Carbohydrate binding domain-containing protein n=1 Tax=Thalassobellus suaedae TaxID=3074124 RepID=A0ABY9XS48_9FLAO|nr:carbohydrate binding domain-containing protein [Flavobacteriaceae bacterium HL-DH14]
MTDPSACEAETAQSLNVADFNVTFQTDPSANIVDTESTFEWVNNPDFNNAVNPSCKVGKFIRNSTFQYSNNNIVFGTPLDFNANAGFKMKVWTPAIGTKVSLKAEGGSEELVTKTTTKAGEWEELTFDFATGTTGNTKLVLFFNIDSNTSGTFYYDDLKLYTRTGGGGGGGTPGTAAGDIAVNGGFEDGNLDGWAAYNNGGTIEAVTTQPSTGTYCAKLFASPETGLNPTLKQERKAAGTLAVGDEVKITFDYRGALTGESGAYSIQSFVEAANGVNQVVNISVAPSDTWQTYSTTYTVAAGDISGGITLEFVAICGGVPGCSSTLYLDNISVIINP